MEDIYYNGDYLVSILSKIGYYPIETLRFKALTTITNKEDFINKYRLLFGKEFKEVELNQNKTEVTINLISNNNKIHIVGSLRELFNYFERLKTLDVSSFDTSMVTDMSNMFYCCYNIEELDLHNFNTSNVKDMSRMFMDCRELRNISLSNFDTSNVEVMNGMFCYCNNLKSLDVSKFDTSNVRSMKSMFDRCTSIKELDLSNFDTSNVEDMTKMFYSCSSLEKLNISNFNVRNTYLEYIFDKCGDMELITDDFRLLKRYDVR